MAWEIVVTNNSTNEQKIEIGNEHTIKLFLAQFCGSPPNNISLAIQSINADGEYRVIIKKYVPKTAPFPEGYSTKNEWDYRDPWDERHGPEGA